MAEISFRYFPLDFLRVGNSERSEGLQVCVGEGRSRKRSIQDLVYLVIGTMVGDDGDRGSQCAR